MTQLTQPGRVPALRLVQLHDPDGRRRVAISNDSAELLPLIAVYERVYDMALASIRVGEGLERFARRHISDERVSYAAAIAERRLLPPLDHPDPARCLVALTGLTHLGSAQSRDRMHAEAAAGTTDSARMFQLGLHGGKPDTGQIGAQPEWAYKGDGRSVVAPEHGLALPAYADDGGEEAEIAGLYVIADDGAPWRVGFAIGNEFADHVLERKNYLYLAHSKLRQCSFGPELLVGNLPQVVCGEVRVVRDGAVLWSAPFESGEANMCHSIANLEHHHFKYELFRRPGDLHIFFFGANGVSFGADIRPRADDCFEIDIPLFGRPLRNPLRSAPDEGLVSVRAL